MGQLKKGQIIGLLTNLVNVPNHTNVYCWLIKNMSFNLLLLIHILLKNIQEFHYYSFAVNLDKYVKNGNTLNELCNKICVPNKKEDLNLSTFNIGEK